MEPSAEELTTLRKERLAALTSGVAPAGAAGALASPPKGQEAAAGATPIADEMAKHLVMQKEEPPKNIVGEAELLERAAGIAKTAQAMLTSLQ